MKMLNKTICLVFAAMMFTACQESKEKLNEKIKLLENEISAEHNPQKRENLLLVYRDYIANYPKDSMSIEYLFKAGTINVSLGKGDEALSDFTNLINRYPKSAYVPQAYYYIAYVYEDVIFDIVAAKAAYIEFIEKYPDHELATDAKLAIRYLGKSPDEIVASFEQEQTNSNTEE
jgi:outer membrane protein assembly factor BamD (BamD/ComL family)